MKTKNGGKNVALLSGAVMLSSTLGASVLTASPARAEENKKSQQLKTGAIALGAIAGYFVLKGKTAPAAIAGAGAYYVYKKSEDEKNRYGQNSTGERYPDDPYYADSRNGDVFPSTSGDAFPGDNDGDYAAGDDSHDDGAYASYPDDGGYDGGFNGLRQKAKPSAKTSLPTVLK